MAVSRRFEKGNVAGAGLLGIIFALSFCPVSAALFFGSLIPISVKYHSSIWLPSLYGIGTGLPVVVFAVLIALGVGWMGTALHRLQAFEKWARFATGLVFIGVGIFETLRSTLYLI